MALSIAPRPFGWCRAMTDDGTVVALRFDVGESERFRVVEVIAAHRDGLNADRVRSLPLVRLQGWARGIGADHLRLELKLRHAATADERNAMDERERNEVHTRAEWGSGAEAEEAARPLLIDSETVRLDVPLNRRRSDDFYRSVAKAHGVAACASSTPTVALAEANGLPVASVRAWVKEARRRGLMAPGRHA